jgi:predicted nucleic acid-binding protein
LIVVDSSAWIELLRKTQSPVHIRLKGLIDSEADLAVTEVVVMELLGGARTRRADLRARLLAYPVIPLQGLQDYEAAAMIYDRCRRAGDPLRHGFMDCLIAVPVLRTGASLLHNDSDFDVIARHTDLELIA